MTACIVGWSHLPFGKREGDDIESMIVAVAQGALEDAGLEAKDVDRIFIGNFNGGFVYQDVPASLVLQADPALRFKPATRVENACALGRKLPILPSKTRPSARTAFLNDPSGMPMA